MRRLVRNAIFTDPSGKRSVLRAGTEVDDEVAATLDPKAFGDAGPSMGSGEPERRVVDEAPLLEALRAYAAGRGVDVGDQDAFDLLDALVDADAELQERLDAARVDNGDEPPVDDEQKRIAEVLEGKVEEVNAYLEGHPEDVEAVLAAEAAAKAPRKGITEGPYASQQE